MRTSLWDKVYSMPRRRAVRFVVAMAILAPVWNETKMMSNIYSFRRSVPQSLPPLWMQHRRLFQHFVQQGCSPKCGVTISKTGNFQLGFHVIPIEYIFFYQFLPVQLKSNLLEEKPSACLCLLLCHLHNGLHARGKLFIQERRLLRVHKNHLRIGLVLFTYLLVTFRPG